MFLVEILLDLLMGTNKSRKRAYVFDLLALLALAVFILVMVVVTELG